MNHNVSLPGRDWLISALDPFHDYQQTLEGFPDQRSTASVVQMHQQNLEITAPASAGVAGNWDCCVYYTGFDSHQTTRIAASATQLAAEYDHTSYTPTELGAINVLADAAGTELDLVTTVARSVLHSQLASVPGRTIAIGIEVHNTTADVFKQGSVTTALIQDSRCDTSTFGLTDVAAVAPWEPAWKQADTMATFPKSASYAKTIPGSATWEAKDGCYLIPRLVKGDIPPHDPTSERANIGAQVGVGGVSYYVSNPIGYINTGTLNFPWVRGLFPASFSPAVIHFSGLSNQSMLMLSVRTLVEYFPAPGSALIGMCTPSPPYDPLALQLYSEAAVSAPYAVKVQYNSIGKYFSMVLSAIGRAAPLISAVLPGPIGGLAGGIGAVASGLATLRSKKGEKKKYKPIKVTSSMAGNSAMSHR